MDIVITIPKSEYGNIDKEIEWAQGLPIEDLRGTTKNWTVGRFPTKIEDGDRCYFIKDGQIVHYREIIGLDETSFTCEVTNRDWSGPMLELSPIPIALNEPVPMKGFRGWRYLRERPQ